MYLTSRSDEPEKGERKEGREKVREKSFIGIILVYFHLAEAIAWFGFAFKLYTTTFYIIT